MNTKFIDQVSQDISYPHKDIIEKDLYIHQLLFKLCSDDYFKGNFLFKGGTCLVKCYLDYYRFSEDIDFTWKNQSIFNGLSVKKQKKNVSNIENEVLKLIDAICEDLGFKFSPNKSDKKFVEFSGNEMRMTLKIYYNSLILNAQSFIKIQINFAEHLCFPNKILRAQNLLSNIKGDTQLLFQEELKKYTVEVEVNVYDLKEIIAEKIRALLTRKGVKARDYVDLYFINEKYGIPIDSIEEDIILKILFAVKRNQQYKNNILIKEKLLQAGPMFRWGDEEKFMLQTLNTQQYKIYLDYLEDKLRSIITKYHLEIKK